MATFDSWYPGDATVAFLLQTTVTVAVIAILGVALAAACWRHPAARHFVLLAALICTLASPALTAVVITAQKAPFVLTLPVRPHEFSHPVATHVKAVAGPAHVEPAFKQASSLKQSPTAVIGDSRVVVAPLMGPGAEKADAWARPVRLAASVAALVWGMGSLFLALAMGRSATRLRAIGRSLRRESSAPIVEVLETARGLVGIRRPVRLAVSDRIVTPIAMGLVHPVIVFPPGLLTALEPGELRDILVHELAHIVRHDQIVILLQAMARVAYWPIWPLHWLNRQLANAREDVCDNYVLAQQQPVHYGETLLRVAALSGNFAACGSSAAVLGWRGRLEDRIVHLVSERRNRSTRVKRRAALGLLSILLAATGGLCGTWLVSAAAELPETKPPASAPDAPPTSAAAIRKGKARETRIEVPSDYAQARAANTPAEKAAVKMVLVFSQDRARRAVYGMAVNNGDHTLILTATSASIVPDGTPFAIDSIFLERAGKPPLEARYEPRSTAEIAVNRTSGVLTGFELTEVAHVAPGDELDAAVSRPLSEIRILPRATRVRAVDQEATVTGMTGAVRYSNLFEVDRGFPEGTPLFKQGRLAGLTIVGTRFLRDDPHRSFVLPGARVAAFCQAIQQDERRGGGKAAGFGLTAPREFPYAVPFEPGRTQFLNGDSIKIEEVRGTADTFKPANIFWIKGTYTLASRDKALLLASTTATEAGKGINTQDLDAQRVIVNRGTGTFTLFLPMYYAGWPHVSFYPAEGGGDLGGAYFGTGDSLHK